MRQVPARRPAPIGIVGSGRAARHFIHYLGLLSIPVRTWSRRAPGTGPVEALEGCASVVLLIPDRAIVPFADTWPALNRTRLVHASGCLVTDVAAVAHPLMTFGCDLYDLATYRSIPFILDAGGPPFETMLPGLPNPTFAIPPDERPRYHALCALAGNLSTLLWLKLFEGLEGRFGIPASAAHPYLARVAANLLADPGRALTGPLVRGDAGTISQHLNALEGDPYQRVYRAFVEAYAHRP